jgi:hypothetical protein
VAETVTNDNLEMPYCAPRFKSSIFQFLAGAMNSEDNHGRDVREKIVSLMQSIGRAPRKPLHDAELQKLRSAASRLEHLLNAEVEANRQALKNASERLNRLLLDIRTGKDVTADLKKRTNREDRVE